MEPSLSSSKTSPREFCQGEFFPITQELAFVEAPATEVADAFVKWRQELGQEWSLKEVGGGLVRGLESLLPLTTPEHTRYIFFACGTWSAIFGNLAHGTDAASLASYLAQRLACRGARLVALERTPCSYPATILELYGPHQTEFLNYLRTIAAMDDGGRWRFEQSGPPLPFEQTSSYAARKIADRFSAELLVQYAHHLGINAFEPSAYSEAILATRGTTPAGTEELSLEAACARLRGAT